jgi:serine/threonine protein phosphatase PrpC
VTPAPNGTSDEDLDDPASGLRAPSCVCPGCSAVGANDGDGYCKACGARLPPTDPCDAPPSDLPTKAPVDARRLDEVAATLGFPEALAVVRSVLDLAERFERAGLSWRPVASDLVIDPRGGLYVAELRGVQKIEPPLRFEVERVLHALGLIFVPHPMVQGPPRLVRLLMPHRSLGARRLWSVADARAALDEIEPLVALPPDAARGVAEVSDIGLKRERDEDATAVASGTSAANEPWSVLVVCDGVSCSSNAATASTIAATTARDALAHHARSGDIDFEAAPWAVAAAIQAAHIAVCAEKVERGATEPPGTTIVVALVYRGQLTVGWVGDSRAYWLTSDGAELLTRDHSWVNEAVATGRMTESDAAREPLAHALTRCLGPLEVGETLEPVEAEVRTRKLVGPGHVVLCTDGLWNYYPDPGALANLVQSARGVDAGTTTASRIARHLVNHAVARGGGDNVSVAVYVHDV